MKITSDTIAIPSLILTSIFTTMIVKYEPIKINYSKSGFFFPVLYIFILCFGSTWAFSNYFFEKFCYVKTNEYCYILTKDSNKIDSNEKSIVWNYYTKEIPNLERFEKLQNFKVKLDLTDNKDYFHDVNKLLYKLNIHKLPRLNIFEIQICGGNEFKIITHNDIMILHKDNYYMANPVFIKKIPQNVTHINFLHSNHADPTIQILDNLPSALNYLKTCDCEYELTNLPVTLKKLILVKSKINKNYAPTEYRGKDFEHKIPFGCQVEHLYQDFYDYVYDL